LRGCNSVRIPEFRGRGKVRGRVDTVRYGSDA